MLICADVNSKPTIYIIYQGKVDPSDTADATIIHTLSGQVTSDQLQDIDSFYAKLPHTIIQYEVSGAQLINGRVYEKENQ